MSETMRHVEIVRVFTVDGHGGNPCAIIADASGMTPAEMQAIAQRHGTESGFVLTPPSADYDFAFRFWVPNHEMEMCGHATIGALWLLATDGRLQMPEVRIETRSGPVTGYVATDTDGTPVVEITQPVGKVVSLAPEQDEAVRSVLGISRRDLLDLPLQNAVTSRVKTLVPLVDLEHLNALAPDLSRMTAVCDRLGSTGLYPYAVVNKDARIFEARQFPRSAGYPEDAATGIAAAALSFALLRNGLVDPDDRAIRVFQGRAMGAFSEIRVRIGFAAGRPTGCLVGGSVTDVAAAVA